MDRNKICKQCDKSYVDTTQTNCSVCCSHECKTLRRKKQ